MSFRLVGRKQFLLGLACSLPGYQYTRSTVRLSVDLLVLRVSIANTNQAAIHIRRVDVRAVNRENVETHNISTLRRHRDGFFEAVFVCRQMRRATFAIARLRDMLEAPGLVRSIQKPDLTVLMEGIVEMHEHINIAIVRVSVERIILVL